VLIHRQLEYLLQQHGLERIETAGQTFDANLHEAMTQEHHDSIAAGGIIAEVQHGYKLQDRLIRPALVRVSQGPAATEGSPATPPDEQAAADRDTADGAAGTVG
jgi:molecular chaperone GrpE